MTYFLLYWITLLLMPIDQAEWPHNPKNKEIEFTGLVAWPKGVTTSKQRQELAKNWYLTKLTDVSVKELSTWAKETHNPLTGFSLPAGASFLYRYGSEPYFVLSYKVHLTASSQGILYKFYRFRCTWVGSDTAGSLDLEPVSSMPKEEQEAIKFFKNKLDSALSEKVLQTL